VAVARLLMDRGADVSAAKGDGWTPLHAAAHNGHTALVRLLTAATAQPASN
jgi:ankyrin repeat protein